MSRATAVGEAYARLPLVARAVPLALAVPFAAELLQHVVEIGIGMYAPGGFAAQGFAPRRMAFGVVKVVALFATILFLLRWFAFADARRALRPSLSAAKGIAIYLAIGIVGELVALGLSRALIRFVGEGVTPAGRAALTAAPVLLWLFFLGLLLPWLIGMVVEDRAMTLARSVAVMRRHLVGTFGTVLAGFLPLMVVHYALGYGALGQAPGTVWLMMIVDAGVAAALPVVLASTYFTIYRRAAVRVDEGF